MDEKELEKILDTFPSSPGILGKEDFFNAVILLLLIEKEGEYHFVFQKRHPDIPQGGEICFPGGGFNPKRDRDLKAAVLRETHEEMGIPPEKIRIRGRMGTMVTLMGMAVDGFVGICRCKMEEMIPCSREVDSIFSIPVSYFQKNPPRRFPVWMEFRPGGNAKENEAVRAMKELGIPEKYLKPWGGRSYDVLIYPSEFGPVWGITARFVHDFVRKMEKAEEGKDG
jgi:8-oxo-dGTP pyrophosphatase MutT (NUDIX family)